MADGAAGTLQGLALRRPGPPTMRAATWAETADDYVRDLYEAVAQQPLARIADLVGVSDFAGMAAQYTDPELGVKGEAISPVGKPGIRAYHGSPHDFDRFDLSKIGTGEGAQAYGHGLYFAGAEDTARYYRDSLQAAKRQAEPVVYAGREYPRGTGTHQVLVDIAEKGKTATIEALEKDIAFNRNYAPTQAALKEHFLDFAKGVDESALVVPKGRMYEVNIAADPATLLDWDAPLSAQSPQVREALARLGVSPKPVVKWQAHQVTPQDIANKLVPANYAPGSWISVVRDPAGRVEWHGGQLFSSEAAAAENAAARSAIDQRAVRDKGGEIYRDVPHVLADRGDAPRLSERSLGEDASEALRRAGIPGLKYADAGSRWTPRNPVSLDGGQTWTVDLPGPRTGQFTTLKEAQAAVDAAKAGHEPTRNYVLFDDSLIDILRKYSLLLGAAGLGAAAAPKKDQ